MRRRKKLSPAHWTIRTLETLNFVLLFWWFFLGRHLFAVTPYWIDRGVSIGIVFAACVAVHYYRRFARDLSVGIQHDSTSVLLGTIFAGILYGYFPAKCGVPMVAAYFGDRHTSLTGSVTSVFGGSPKSPAQVTIEERSSNAKLSLTVAKDSIGDFEQGDKLEVSGHGNALFFRVERIEWVEPKV